MCGIAGWIDYNGNINEGTRHNTVKMSDTLGRRGPDAHGAYFDNEAAIVHRRLTVIDPENGCQPMLRQAGETKFILTYNGELYNTGELRTELADAGFSFEGHSDTEVLLLSYIHWGAACVERFNGIYAFAVWNNRERTLFMARDKVGVKPLFYHSYNGGLIFGSEIKTLLAHDYITPQIDRSGIAEIFLLGPGRTPGHGVFRGIKELKPGYCALFSRDRLKVRPYCRLTAKEHTDSLDTTIEKVRWLVTDAITRQLVSDVPLCTFLSGGLDSSIITHIASQKYSAEGRRLTSFSVDYTDNDKYFTPNAFQPNSDNYYIDIMKDFSRTDHRSVVLRNHDLFYALRDAALARDLPGMADVDSSLLLFAKKVKNDFTVAVSGECADEIFGGYPWYHNPEVVNREMFPWSVSTELRAGLLREGVLGAVKPLDYVLERYRATLAATDKLPGEDEVNARMREMFMLNIHWFMQTLLDRKDRMTMYSGLEVRVPFCDWRIMEYLYNVPVSMRHYEGREKGLLRKAMEGILPDEIIYRKKSPYPKTFHPRYLSLLKGTLSNVVSRPSSRLVALVDRKKIMELVETDGNAFTKPWYGQLMTGPQVMAYLLQVNYWLEAYNIDIVD